MFEKMETEKTIKMENSNVASVAKTGKNRKALSVIALVVSVVAVVAAAVAIGIYVYMKETVIKDRRIIDGTLDQETSIYSDRKIVVYQSKENNVESIINADYNTYITVVKVLSSSKVCFASILNDSSKFNLDRFKFQDEPMSIANATTIYYQPLPTKVSDISFMNKLARNMCNGLDVYWMSPMCYNPSVNTLVRLKRSFEITIRFQAKGCTVTIKISCCAEQ